MTQKAHVRRYQLALEEPPRPRVGAELAYEGGASSRGLVSYE